MMFKEEFKGLTLFFWVQIFFGSEADLLPFGGWEQRNVYSRPGQRSL